MLFHYLLLLPVTVIIIIMVTMIANGRYHQHSDRILIALLGCSGLSYYITFRALVDGTTDYLFIILDNIESAVALAICPLLFLFMRMMTKDTNWHRWYWWLFAPGIILCTIGTTLSLMVGWDRILEIRHHDYQIFIPAPDNMAEILYRRINIDLFNYTLEVMALVMIAMSIYYLIRYQNRAVDFYANLEDSYAGKIGGFLVTSIILLISIFMITMFVRTLISWREDYLVCISLFSTILICVIQTYAYRIKPVKPYIEVIETPADIAPKLQSKALEKTISAWEKRVDSPFCKEGLTLQEAADAMSVSPRALSGYINTQKGVNFNRWINTLRIAKAKNLLKDVDVKITYISTICGFADQSSFTNVFRQLEGQSPQDYRKAQHPSPNT